MAAKLITSFKDVTPEGGVIELVVWRVPQPVPPSAHGYKYRAAYSVGGVRVVGFDNERGKGDHCHLGGRELPYTFSTVHRGGGCRKEREMTARTLTITLQPDWKGALRAAGKRARAASYQGEVLNFESAGAFFGRLTERRWALVHALQGQGAMAVRELARRVGRDVKRVHEDVQVLAELGLVERAEGGGVLCPFAGVHIDMELLAAA